MSEGTTREWCRMFKNGWTDVHHEERSGWPAICDDLVQSVDQNIVKDGALQFQKCCVNFHIFSHILYEIITFRVGYHKMGSK
jgi:hypothetical protein